MELKDDGKISFGTLIKREGFHEDWVITRIEIISNKLCIYACSHKNFIKYKDNIQKIYDNDEFVSEFIKSK